MVEDNLQEVPFDMAKETLKSIREWIDNITQVSIGVISGQKIDSNEMIVLKYKMVKQLIVLSSPLLEDNLDEIEAFFSNIKIIKGEIKSQSGRLRNVPVFSSKVANELDECVQGIEKALKIYFLPIIKEGQRY